MTALIILAAGIIGAASALIAYVLVVAIWFAFSPDDGSHSSLRHAEHNPNRQGAEGDGTGAVDHAKRSNP